MLKLSRHDGLLVLLHRMFTVLPPLIMVVLALVAPAEVRGQQAASSKIELKTTSFTPGGFIPKRFTCEAADVSPALAWTDPPLGTQSFAIIEDDPDAPSGTFVHWVVYDLPAAYRKLPEALSGNNQMLGGGRQGTNDFSRTGYSGPCPPPGRPHRYFIRLYAVDAILNLRPAASRKELDAAMKGHILAQAELMGRFQR
ncbi:MAG: YbhB/YbcL family Raf kinase inhibitor-like protein [Terriglobia bacterium]